VLPLGYLGSWPMMANIVQTTFNCEKRSATKKGGLKSAL